LDVERAPAGIELLEDLDANITPFSADLPVMKKVEIGDVAVAYDDPDSLETYLLVMRNVLLIPSMDHNLLPPFLVREAFLFLDDDRGVIGESH